jgi:hypothetical protein
MFDKSLDITSSVKKSLMDFVVRYTDKKVSDSLVKDYSKLLYKYYIILEGNDNPYTLQEKFKQPQIEDAFQGSLAYLAKNPNLSG